MTVVDVAERKARWRAFAFLFLGGLTVALMAFNIRSGGTTTTVAAAVPGCCACAAVQRPAAATMQKNCRIRENIGIKR